jgi:hypothetical protein
MIKTMLIIFFDKQGVIHKELMPEGQTVNSCGYRNIVEAHFSGEATISSRGQLILVARECPFPFRTGSEDISGQIRCCGDKPFTLLSWSRTREFFLFPTVKIAFKGKRFQDIDDI